MRYLLLAIIGFGLVTGGLFVQWGYKEVTRAQCSEVQGAEGPQISCQLVRFEAVYWSDHITADVYTWQEVDQSRMTAEAGFREIHDYQMASPDYLDGNQGLFWGRPIMLLGLGLGVLGFVSMGATARRTDASRWAAIGLTAVGGGALAVGGIMAIGGMISHSGSWSGVIVEPFQPRAGGLLVSAGIVAGVYGIVRYAQQHANILRGVTGNSPLAPILEIDHPEPAVDERGRRIKPKLVFTVDIFIPLLAGLLLAMSTHSHIGFKDMTLYECVDGPEGVSCQKFEMEVTYRIYGTIFDGLNGTTSSAYDDVERNFDGPMSTGSFTDFYPGHTMLGWAYPMLIIGAVVSGLVGLAQPWRARWGVRVAPWVNVGLFTLVAGIIGTALGAIVYQSMIWPGTPAGNFRPGPGLILYVLAGGLFVTLLVRSFKWSRKAQIVKTDAAPA